MLAKYIDIELAVQLGEYQAGTDKDADRAIQMKDNIREFLVQGHNEKSEFGATVKLLKSLCL